MCIYAEIEDVKCTKASPCHLEHITHFIFGILIVTAVPPKALSTSAHAERERHKSNSLFLFGPLFVYDPYAHMCIRWTMDSHFFFFFFSLQHTCFVQYDIDFSQRTYSQHRAVFCCAVTTNGRALRYHSTGFYLSDVWVQGRSDFLVQYRCAFILKKKEGHDMGNWKVKATELALLQVTLMSWL